jgi:hypothetical protein
LGAFLFVTLGLGIWLSTVHAQGYPNTTTFNNHLGEPALVKLMGPTGQTIEVPSGESRMVNVAAGEYYLLVRYGSKPEQYSYSKGEPFTVEQTSTRYSAITITLHKVVGGNYPINPTSKEQFEKAVVGGETSDKPSHMIVSAQDNPEMVIFANGLNNPFGLAFDSNENLLFTDRESDGRGIIGRITPSGKVEILIKSPKKADGKYILKNLGAISFLEDNSIVTIDYSSGNAYKIPSSLETVEESSYFGLTERYNLADGKAIICYTMTVDHKNKLLFVAGPNVEKSTLGVSMKGLLVYMNNLGKGAFGVKGREIFLKDVQVESDPWVTSSTVRGDDLFLALEGLGIFYSGADKVLRKLDTKDIFEGKQILGIVFDSQKNLYVATNESGSKGIIYRIASDGSPIKTFAEGFTAPAGLAIRGDHLYVADFGDGKIYKIKIVL